MEAYRALVSDDDPEFNFQQWVDYALRTLYHAGHLTLEQCQTGLNDMIDATMEVEDEDNAVVVPRGNWVIDHCGLKEGLAAALSASASPMAMRFPDFTTVLSG